MATRHVLQGVAHVARQRELIDRLGRRGYDTTAAENLLHVMEDALGHHRTHLAQVTGRRVSFISAPAKQRDRATHRETVKQQSGVYTTRTDASLEEALRECSADILKEPIPARLLQAVRSQPERGTRAAANGARHPARTTTPRANTNDPRCRGGQHGANDTAISPAMDQDSFRDMLAFSIGFAVEQNRPLLRRILNEHVSDEARHMLANKMIQHLELSGFQVDEERQIMTKRRGHHGHG
jgi:hypothetical protein